MKKELSKLHRELLTLRYERIYEATRFLEQRKAEIQSSVNLIATELGIDVVKEHWDLSPDLSTFTKREPLPAPDLKRPTPLIPKGK